MVDNVAPETIVNNIADKFEILKKEIDKYPEMVSLEYSEEFGYCLMIDYDHLEHNSAVECLTPLQQ